jgi:hypothetical protein
VQRTKSGAPGRKSLPDRFALRIEPPGCKQLKHWRNRGASLKRPAGRLVRPAGPALESSLKTEWFALLTAVLVSVACLFATSCGRNKSDKPADAPDAGLVRGDYVVVEPEAARFFEARVLSVEGPRLRVQRVEGGDTAMVATADIYRLPPARHPFKPADFAVCRAREMRWVGCRIESATSTTVVAREAEGARMEVDATRVLLPNSVTELNLRRQFERADRRSRFQREIVQAGTPHAPPSWRPSPRDRVVVRDETGWYSATVQEIDDGEISVQWHVDQRVTKVARGSIVPEPSNSQVLKSGKFALLRPEGPAQPWRPVRIESTLGGALSVVDLNGQRRGAAPRDLIPLVTPDAG